MNIEPVREEARQVFVEFTNGMCEAMALGRKTFMPIVGDAMRLNCLSGMVENNELSDTSIESLRHYKGRFISVDLSQIGVVPNPSSPTETTQDLLRSGSQTASIGANAIVFSSPLGTDEYTVNVWIIGDGESQYDLGDITRATTGFTVSDALIEGTLYYQVIVVV